MARVAPGFHVLAGVVVRTPLAVVVDRFAVGKEWASVLVERRPPLERQVVHDERRQVLDVRRAGRQVDEGLEARDGVGDRQRARRIGRCRRQPAERGAGADGNRRGRAAAHFTRDVEG